MKCTLNQPACGIKSSIPLLLSIIFGAIPGDALAEDVKPLMQMSLEELMQVNVTTAASHPQNAFHTPASVFVISAEDIERSTARNIPDLLRSVPGIEVAQIDANKWAITARGFNSLFANKLLVLIDGVSVYTPVFSGVYWNQDILPLEEIERIEIIRGPGAAVWGANACNGVINIISKNSRETMGGRANVNSGNPMYFQGYGSIGAKLSEGTTARSWAYGSNTSDYGDTSAADAHDSWDLAGGGIRLDSSISEKHNLTTIVKGYATDPRSTGKPFDILSGSIVPFPTRDRGVGLTALFDWEHNASDKSHYNVVFWATRADRRDLGIATEINTYDLRAQHDLLLNEELRLTYGASGRLAQESLNDAPEFGAYFTNEKHRLSLGSFFAQAESEIIPEMLSLTLGSKAEYHSFSGWGLLPNIRLGMTPAEKHFVWAALSRALRVPSRSDQNTNLFNSGGFVDSESGLPVSQNLVAHDDDDTERIAAIELGYRRMIDPSISFDLVSFYSKNRGLVGVMAGEPTFESNPIPHFEQPLFNQNIDRANTYGVEIGSKWFPGKMFQLSGSYTYFTLEYDPVEDSEFPLAGIDEHGSPRHRVSVNASWMPNDKLTVDGFYGFTDSLSNVGVDAYHRMDLKLGYRLKPNLQLYLTGQNLLESVHEEYRISYFVENSQMPRAYLVGMDWTF